MCGVPILKHFSKLIMCLNIGTPKNHHSPFGTNGKALVCGVPILEHFRVVFVGHTCHCVGIVTSRLKSYYIYHNNKAGLQKSPKKL